MSTILKDDTYHDLFEISKGKLDLFRRATDDFVQAAETSEVVQQPEPSEESQVESDNFLTGS